jgi:hypothetical protein
MLYLPTTDVNVDRVDGEGGGVQGAAQDRICARGHDIQQANREDA